METDCVTGASVFPPALPARAYPQPIRSIRTIPLLHSGQAMSRFAPLQVAPSEAKRLTAYYTKELRADTAKGHRRHSAATLRTKVRKG